MTKFDIAGICIGETVEFNGQRGTVVGTKTKGVRVQFEGEPVCFIEGSDLADLAAVRVGLSNSARPEVEPEPEPVVAIVAPLVEPVEFVPGPAVAPVLPAGAATVCVVFGTREDSTCYLTVTWGPSAKAKPVFGHQIDDGEMVKGWPWYAGITQKAGWAVNPALISKAGIAALRPVAAAPADGWTEEPSSDGDFDGTLDVAAHRAMHPAAYL